MDGGGASSFGEVLVLVVVVVVVVLVGYWWLHSCGDGAGDSLCKAGSCNICRSTLIVAGGSCGRGSGDDCGGSGSGGSKNCDVVEVVVLVEGMVVGYWWCIVLVAVRVTVFVRVAPSLP